MAEDKPFIPMDDPRRIYKVPGTNYAMCHPGLTGNWAGYKNTPEEQKVMDEFHRANLEEVKHMKPAELRAHIEALKKSVNDKDEADRLWNEDITRQQDELRAQREVERRVYYRQKALKEAKKKAKEERAREKAIARGEIVDGGEDSAGPNGPAQSSDGAMTGVTEDGAINGGNARIEDGIANAQDDGSTAGPEIRQGQGIGGEHIRSSAHQPALSQDQATAERLANTTDNDSDIHGVGGIA